MGTLEMNDGHDHGRHRRSSPRWAVAVTVLTALATTACGATPSPVTAPSGSIATTARSTSSPSAVAYSACMRSHGVPNFPDPDSKGGYPSIGPQRLGVSSAQYQAAEQDCQYLLPTGGSLQQQTNQCLWFGNCPPALLQQLMNLEREYAECMRAHGTPNWPDPTVAKGRPVFDLSSAGIDPQSTDSARLAAQDDECRRSIGGSVPRLPTT